METLREKLQGPTDWLRNTLMLPDRRMSAGLAIGALAFSGITELSAHRFPETNVIGRFARRSLRLAALTTFALALWQTERVGELKEQPKRTSVEVTRESLQEASLILQKKVDQANEYREEANSSQFGRWKDNKLDMSRRAFDYVEGMADLAGVLKLPDPEGFESWEDAVSSASLFNKRSS